MSRLLEPPAKFLPPEWKYANQVHLRNAEAERARSERLTAECRRLIEESNKSAKRMQKDASKRLEQRIHDIKFWRQELDQKLEDMVQEIELLITFKRRVERALESCSEPLKVTLQCLEEREKRVGFDRVHDEVERELMKEKEVIEGVAALLQQTLEQITEQIRLNRSAKYHLEKDLRDKFQAEKIDDFCSILTSTSSSIEGQVNGNIDRNADLSTISTAVTREEWESFSDVNIYKTEKEKNNSLTLRALVESLLEQTAADMQRQNKATGIALERCIQETKIAKAQLEETLNKLLAEIASQQRNLEGLRVAISDKEGPQKVAQTRLNARSRRPTNELCHDLAHVRLLAEVEELTRHINRLRESLAKSELELRELTRNQLALEKEIQVKSHSLYIDEVICTQLRQPISIHNF
ncbi:tektin-1 [Chanos chanos]|uniref:Tektin n=1 Tax=Chanos chanos TaxID=29144 RepID=A0A6J2VNP5_CHACN|nr:tektin-1 [Chanos chanos]